jgi:nucleoside 2-deoxyribosyltransferase
MTEIYLAAPFFTKKQLAIQTRVEELCTKYGRSFFSPRLECLCPPNATPEQRAKTFDLNIQHIEKCDIVFARIDDFDPGTMWELGYAFAMKRPAFAYTVVPDRGLNLMLAQSGLRLVRGWDEIEEFLKGNTDVARSWKEDII